MRFLEQSIKAIEDAGFSHIKVELEANLDRDAESDDYCDECSDGCVSCYNCDGTGAVDTGETVGIYNETVWAECDDCYGDGYRDCNYCDGSGGSQRDSEFSSDSYCEEFILGRLSDAAREQITYANFYNDGSVDSELTFTIPVAQSKYLPEFLNAFSELAEAIGNDMDVDGAGMHISVIPEESNGSYPCYGVRLPREKLQNFMTENTKLLPALFFLASPNNRSRGLSYRIPRVCDDEKYSAIYTHGGTCFEYRLFETCYERPEAIFDYIAVIANSLKFYANPSLKAKKLNKTFAFPDGYGREGLSRFYNTPEQLRVLNAQLKELKPADKSVRKLKQERGIAVTISEMVTKRRVQRAKLTNDYKEMAKVNAEIKAKPITPEQEREIQRVRSYYGYTRQEAMQSVLNLRDLPSLRVFLDRNLNNLSGRTVQV